MPKMSKKEYDESVKEFIKWIDHEIGQWGIYKNSPEGQTDIKKGMIDRLIQLPELQKTATIIKLLESKIFTQSEIDQGLIIPIEERGEFTLDDLRTTKVNTLF
ncbi:unnamed protein product [marine sediment metagenome]|uniref:Uncharacterized protein n=1 Tax=marine sediment metagenome TaxID=412755 RepID=X1KJF6_9ZZZZ